MKQTENQRIKILRETLKLTQGEFATASNLSYSLISKMEADSEPTEKAKNKICTAFNVSGMWIDQGKGEMFLSGTILENIERTKTLLKNSSNVLVNPWQDEAYKQVKEENLTLRQQLDKLTQALLNLSSRANPNFLKASDVAEFPYNLLKSGDYSGAIAQC